MVRSSEPIVKILVQPRTFPSYSLFKQYYSIFNNLGEKKTEKKIKKKNKSGDTIEEKETKVKEED